MSGIYRGDTDVENMGVTNTGNRGDTDVGNYVGNRSVVEIGNIICVLAIRQCAA